MEKKYIISIIQHLILSGLIMRQKYYINTRVSICNIEFYEVTRDIRKIIRGI